MTQGETVKSRKILHIEDDNFQIDLFKGIINKNFGGEVKIYNEMTLKGGLEALNSNDFDVVILDITLPDSTGLIVIEKVYDVAKKTPIIVLTGTGDDELGLKAVRIGAQDYLVKGLIAPTSLIRCINYAIIRKRIENNLISTVAIG